MNPTLLANIKATSNSGQSMGKRTIPNPFNAQTQVNSVYKALGVSAPSSGINPYPIQANTITPKATTQANTGGSTRSTYSAPKVDPYAKWGGRAGLDQARTALMDSLNNSANQSAASWQYGAEDTLNALTQNQNNINRMGAMNELARTQGRQGILGMVGRNLRSSGVMLANKNASDSSAAGALANAYGDIGHRELNKVGNQYAMQNEEIGRLQENQNRDLTTKINRLREDKNFQVNDIVNKARTAIGALNADMANASIPDRIAMEQEINRIKNDMLNRLQGLDSQLASAPSNIRADSADARRAEAQRMAQQGMEASNPFEFNQDINTQFQGGPFAGNMPLYTFPRSRREG